MSILHPLATPSIIKASRLATTSDWPYPNSSDGKLLLHSSSRVECVMTALILMKLKKYYNSTLIISKFLLRALSVMVYIRAAISYFPYFLSSYSQLMLKSIGNTTLLPFRSLAGSQPTSARGNSISIYWKHFFYYVSSWRDFEPEAKKTPHTWTY